MSAPYFTDDAVTLWHGDCLDVLRDLPDASVDAVVTDPPYGLEFMGREWDSFGGQRREGSRGGTGDKGVLPGYGRGGTSQDRFEFRQRASNAFQQWSELWARECLRVLKPGGHMLAFGGSRTWHRLAVAVEDAGFEVRDSIAWLYGSGFPKSLDVSKAIDKLDAAEERRRRALEFTAFIRESGLTAQRIDALTGTNMGGHYTTAESQPAVATAEHFDKLRPHLPEVPERIEDLVRQRTVESENFKAREVVGIDRRMNEPSGVVNIGQGERTEVERKITNANTPAAQQWQGWGTALKPAFEPIVVGRKPLVGTVAANMLAHGTGALNVDGCRVGTETRTNNAGGASSLQRVSRVEQGYRDTVTASVGEASEVSGRWPTNVVLDGHAAAVLDRQSGVLTSGTGAVKRTSAKGGDRSASIGAESRAEGTPMLCYGDSGGASRFFPTFRYEAKAPTLERPRHGEVAHPTVKPLDLMRWLVRLVTPPGGTVLEPFAGSGTTAEACVLEGFHCIAIEREADYLPLITARLTKPLQPGLNFEEAAS